MDFEQLEVLFTRHSNAKCGSDCSFCEELLLSGTLANLTEWHYIRMRKGIPYAPPGLTYPQWENVKRALEPWRYAKKKAKPPKQKAKRKRKKAKGRDIESDESGLPAKSSQRGKRGGGWLY